MDMRGEGRTGGGGNGSNNLPFFTKTFVWAFSGLCTCLKHRLDVCFVPRTPWLTVGTALALRGNPQSANTPEDPMAQGSNPRFGTGGRKTPSGRALVCPPPWDLCYKIPLSRWTAANAVSCIQVFFSQNVGSLDFCEGKPSDPLRLGDKGFRRRGPIFQTRARNFARQWPKDHRYPSVTRKTWRCQWTGHQYAEQWIAPERQRPPPSGNHQTRFADY